MPTSRLTVVLVTQALMAAPNAVDVKAKWKAVVVAAAHVATGAHGGRHAAGWALLPPVPNAGGYGDPFSWAGAWLVTAGGVPALANVLSAAVFERVRRRAGSDAQAAGAGQISPCGS